MLEPQDIKTIESVLDRVIEKRFDEFEVVIDKKIDDLAGMVKSGFDDVDKRFEQVDKRFEQVDNRLNGIDMRLDGIDERLGRIENLIVTDHRHRIEHLELELQRVKDMFAFK